MLRRASRAAALAGSPRAAAPLSPAAAAPPRVRVLPLDGGLAALEAARRAVEDGRPQQVMFEACEQRRALALAAHAAPAASSAAAGSGAPRGPPLSHADAIALVHGGVRGGDLAALLAAAEQVGASTYMVDRPYQETQNRVARRLAFRPRELLALTRYAAASLVAHATPSPEAEELRRQHGAALAERCPAVREILCGERERHMAAEALRRAVPGAEALLLCTEARAEALRRLLGQGPQGPGPGGAPSSQGASRVWPFLLVLLYLVIPGYGAIFLAWRCSRRLAALISPAPSAAPWDGDGAPAPAPAQPVQAAEPGGGHAAPPR